MYKYFIFSKIWIFVKIRITLLTIIVQGNLLRLFFFVNIREIRIITKARLLRCFGTVAENCFSRMQNDTLLRTTEIGSPLSMTVMSNRNKPSSVTVTSNWNRIFPSSIMIIGERRKFSFSFAHIHTFIIRMLKKKERKKIDIFLEHAIVF